VPPSVQSICSRISQVSSFVESDLVPQTDPTKRSLGEWSLMRFVKHCIHLPHSFSKLPRAPQALEIRRPLGFIGTAELSSNLETEQIHHDILRHIHRMAYRWKMT
jgi:hypothetical protein